MGIYYEIVNLTNRGLFVSILGRPGFLLHHALMISYKHILPMLKFIQLMLFSNVHWLSSQNLY